jgi:threonine/homoserine/homoserine lactone efflux protein
MTTAATVVGIVLQVLGAGFLVWCAWRTSRNLGKFPKEVTYNALGPTIDALTRELRTQFSQQMVGFVFVLAGAGLQLYASLAA